MTTRDDVFHTISAGYRQERKRESLKAVLSVATYYAIAMLVAAVFVILMVWARSAKEEIPWETAAQNALVLWLLIFVVFGFLGGLILRENLRDIREREESKLQYWHEQPELSYHTEPLFEYGFYELALQGYTENLENLFEEARKREEELARFFEEYRTLPRFVDDFPRPIPFFQNHDLWKFEHNIMGRARCLVMLDRKEEAEAEIARRNVLRTIWEEGRELAKKYWNENDYD